MWAWISLRGSHLADGLSSWAEWATVLVALVAVVFSFIAFVWTRRATKNADFFQLHDRLMSLEVQRGRRLLMQADPSRRSWARIHTKRPDEWDAINHAVGVDHMLAQFYIARLVAPKRVETTWFSRIRVAWPQMESFVDYRRFQSDHLELWADLVSMARDAGADVHLPDVGLLPG